MKLRPLHDYIIVEVEPATEFTRGGIIKVAPEPVRVGRVKAVGPGRFYLSSRTGKSSFVPTELKVGERIAFFKAVTETQQGKQLQYRLPDNTSLLRETDALFVLPDDLAVEVTR
jgi:co-chaperonin GroES (HSP10)